MHRGHTIFFIESFMVIKMCVQLVQLLNCFVVKLLEIICCELPIHSFTILEFFPNNQFDFPFYSDTDLEIVVFEILSL